MILHSVNLSNFLSVFNLPIIIAIIDTRKPDPTKINPIPLPGPVPIIVPTDDANAPLGSSNGLNILSAKKPPMPRAIAIPNCEIKETIPQIRPCILLATLLRTNTSKLVLTKGRTRKNKKPKKVIIIIFFDIPNNEKKIPHNIRLIERTGIFFEDFPKIPIKKLPISIPVVETVRETPNTSELVNDKIMGPRRA